MGGLLGRAVLPLRGIDAFWPFLSLAPWVHAGKGATMGLGAMRIVPL
jgi:CRISPR/Cas system endoribonuclease Cas6 (RAMP superfamily)